MRSGVNPDRTQSHHWVPLLLVATAVCGLSGLAPAGAAAKTIAVYPDGSGRYGTIQAALDAAKKKDVIQLAPGVYQGPGNVDLDFLGLQVTLRGDPNDPASRVIACDGRENLPQRAIHFRSGENRNTVVAGILFRGGYAADREPPASSGGTVLCEGASPEFRDCVFIDSRAYTGGAVSLTRSNAQFIRCRFTDNSAEIGGAVMAMSGAPVFEQCEFTGNTAAKGGAAFGLLSNMVIIGSTFQTNTAGVGGAVACEERSRLLLDQSLLTDNFASYGGAVQIVKSEIIVDHCSLIRNSGGSGGALLLRGASKAVITNSILAYSPKGQGIAGVLDADLDVRCTLIYGNADGDWVESAAALKDQHGNLQVPPGLVNLADGDFSLRADSPSRTSECGVLGALH